MRFCLLLLLGYLVSVGASAAQIRTDTLAAYLQELRAATAQHQSLWGIDLYAPLLLADPTTRQVYATEPDAEGRLIRQGTIFTGTLPAEVNLANTAMNWAGRHWAMVLLPLPQNKHDRLNLLTHELFHRIQPELGFKISEHPNHHLDQQNGRIWLRLELEALQQAINAPKPKVRKQHLQHALHFRQYRHQLYPGADSAENLLELNEGLAEYTGLLMSGRSRPSQIRHIQQSQQQFLGNPAFTRSFAYHTVPVYGYLLQQENPQWHRQITAATNLTYYFRKAFALPDLPAAELPAAVAALAGQYGGTAIMQEETAREKQRQQVLANYRKQFLEQPHVVLPFEQMNISFDPRNLVSLQGHGTVYPNLRITDNWGILTVENGALVSTNWDKVTLSAPTTSDGHIVRGEGWQLELKKGYFIQHVQGTSHFVLKKE